MNAPAFAFELSRTSPAELRKAVTARLEAHAAAIETLLLLLDHMDGDPDLEPTLGAPEAHIMLPWTFLPDINRVPEGDQSQWADGSSDPGSDDVETVNEDGGDILDSGEGADVTPGGSELPFCEGRQP